MTVDFEDLYESHRKCQAGVIWKDSVAWFSLHSLEQCSKLCRELSDGSYRPRPPVAFTIYKPKRREILAVAYRDRVYQRAINDRLLYPIMTRSFVPENGACQHGRGTDYCLALFRRNLRRYFINHGADGFILQMDVRRYYPSLRHDAVKAMFRRKVPGEVYEAVAEILDGQYPGDVGYNPGSQMVQIAGISFLDGVDHFVKEKLDIKHYVRVMDDMVLIHHDRDYLEQCRREITRELAALGLEPHPDKTQIRTLRQGITWLGFDWRLTETGKVLQQPKSQTVREFRYVLRKLLRLYANGKRSLRCADESARSRLAHMSKGTSWRLIRRLEKWYAEERRNAIRERKENELLQAAHAEPAGARGNGQSAR